MEKLKLPDINVSKKKIIKEFETMVNLAELKALSNFSLEHKLNDKQYKKMMDLKKEIKKGWK